MIGLAISIEGYTDAKESVSCNLLRNMSVLPILLMYHFWVLSMWPIFEASWFMISDKICCGPEKGPDDSLNIKLLYGVTSKELRFSHFQHAISTDFGLFFRIIYFFSHYVILAVMQCDGKH